MFCNKACQGVSIVRPVLLSLTETIYHDDAHAGGYFAGAGEGVQWLKNTTDQGIAGAGITAGQGQLGLDGLVRLQQVEVWRQLWSLGHLGRDGMDKLWQEAGRGVVSLTEVVSYQVSGY